MKKFLALVRTVWLRYSKSSNYLHYTIITSFNCLTLSLSVLLYFVCNIFFCLKLELHRFWRCVGTAPLVKSMFAIETNRSRSQPHWPLHVSVNLYFTYISLFTHVSVTRIASEIMNFLFPNLYVTLIDKLNRNTGKNKLYI